MVLKPFFTPAGASLSAWCAKHTTFPFEFGASGLNRRVHPVVSNRVDWHLLPVSDAWFPSDT
jgi:hypothetical protein